ncbi:MAG: hypothetical protein H7Y86_13535 [Rhizobacter sp.]|nr:hypothetical protein [Ferruginibacter sp.]
MQAQNPHGVLTIKSGATLNIGKNAALVTNSDIDNRGTLKNAGSIILNGNTAQSFPGTAGSIPTMNLLEVKNTGAGINLNRNIEIGKELKLTAGNLALGNYDVTVQSNATQTAAVSAIGAGAGVSYGAGRFKVERYIGMDAGGNLRAWQFLSVPANGQTIKDCWQEGGSTTVGYGTVVTNPLGTAAGYDYASPGTSIKTYISANSAYDQGPASTSSLINNAKGYMLFVRGDRTVSYGLATAPTTLRIRGTLFTPADPPASVSISSDKYESIGNPYASQIDFTLLDRTGGLDNTFYTWDPLLTGLYGVGAYQTISGTNSWIPVPGGGNYTGVHKTIESGQAFFVHASATPGTISFSEDAKTGGSTLVNRGEDETGLTTRQFIRSTLLTSTGSIADGNAAVFDIDFSNAVNRDDALKIMKGGENFGLKRGNQFLAVEGRSPVVTSDTLFYFTNNLLQQAYSILIVPENMDLSKAAWLIDNFLQTQTPVSLSDSNYINFNVTNNPLSSSSNRFMLVFKTLTVLANSGTILQASRSVDGTIAIKWKNVAENNTKEYILEKSADAILFTTLTTKTALMNMGTEANYGYNDMLPFEGNNFYRIKIVALNGAIKYSEIVKVALLKNAPAISIYPNPLKGRLLNIHFTSSMFGDYNIALINKAGQQVWTSSILYNTGSGNNIQLVLPKNLIAGGYHLNIIDKEGKSYNIALMLL